MIEIMLKHKGDGRFEVTNRDDWITAKEEVPRDAVVRAELKFPRSSKENRLVHGAIKSAYDNQRGGPMFSEEEGGWLKLRAWLLCEAGHCDVEEFAPGSLAETTIVALRKRDENHRIYSFWSQRVSDGQIICRTPRSIKFSVVRHPDFQPVKTKILDLLCNLICPGTTPEQLMEERYVGVRVRRSRKAARQMEASA